MNMVCHASRSVHSNDQASCRAAYDTQELTKVCITNVISDAPQKVNCGVFSHFRRLIMKPMVR